MSRWIDGVTDGAEMARGFGVNLDFTGPMIGRYVTNGYAGMAMTALALTTLALANTDLQLAPYFAPRTFSIDRLGINVTTGVASAKAKCLIYSSTDDGWPDVPVVAPTDDLDCATSSVFREHTLAAPFQFEAAKLYWIGIRSNSTATVRAIALGALRSIHGPDSLTGSNAKCKLSRPTVYANSPPSPWTFNAAELVTGAMPNVLFRVSTP